MLRLRSSGPLLPPSRSGRTDKAAIQPRDGRPAVGVTGAGALRAASLIDVFLGVLFGASVPLVVSYLRRNGELPMMFGFGALSGPFEGFGTERFIALGWLRVAVCGTDVAAGLLLWRRRRVGAWLGLVTTPLAFGLGIGFALPLIVVGCLSGWHSCSPGGARGASLAQPSRGAA